LPRKALMAARTAQLVVRVSQEVVDEIDAVTPRLRDIPEYAFAHAGRTSRSSVVRYLLLRGLEVVRAELAENEPTSDNDKK